MFQKKCIIIVVIAVFKCSIRAVIPHNDIKGDGLCPPIIIAFEAFYCFCLLAKKLASFQTCVKYVQCISGCVSDVQIIKVSFSFSLQSQCLKSLGNAKLSFIFVDKLVVHLFHDFISKTRTTQNCY